MIKACQKGDSYKSKYCHPTVLLLFVIAVLFLPQTKAQDYNNPCFFCHMNVVVDMKAEALKHWEAEVGCEVCHGASEEHIDVEDNSIKPDSIWTENDVHLLCRRCHDASFSDYRKSAHAKWLIGPKTEKTKKSPGCVTCHGAHGLKAEQIIKEACLGCHAPLPKTCEAEFSSDDPRASSITCKGCHNMHSLEDIIKPTPSDSTRRKL